MKIVLTKPEYRFPEYNIEICIDKELDMDMDLVLGNDIAPFESNDQHINRGFAPLKLFVPEIEGFVKGRVIYKTKKGLNSFLRKQRQWAKDKISRQMYDSFIEHGCDSGFRSVRRDRVMLFQNHVLSRKQVKRVYVESEAYYYQALNELNIVIEANIPRKLNGITVYDKMVMESLNRERNMRQRHIYERTNILFADNRIINMNDTSESLNTYKKLLNDYGRIKLFASNSEFPLPKPFFKAVFAVKVPGRAYLSRQKPRLAGIPSVKDPYFVFSESDRIFYPDDFSVINDDKEAYAILSRITGNMFLPYDTPHPVYAERKGKEYRFLAGLNLNA